MKNKEIHRKEDFYMEQEYRCNNCGEYFRVTDDEINYPPCPCCGSSDTWDF